MFISSFVSKIQAHLGVGSSHVSLATPFVKLWFRPSIFLTVCMSGQNGTLNEAFNYVITISNTTCFIDSAKLPKEMT